MGVFPARWPAIFKKKERREYEHIVFRTGSMAQRIPKELDAGIYTIQVKSITKILKCIF